MIDKNTPLLMSLVDDTLPKDKCIMLTQQLIDKLTDTIIEFGIDNDCETLAKEFHLKYFNMD